MLRAALATWIAVGGLFAATGCGAGRPEDPPCIASSMDPRRYQRVGFLGTATWSEGRAECIRRGSDLAVLDTIVEYNLIRNLGVIDGYGPWIGITDRDAEDEWESVNGCPIALRWGRFINEEPDGGSAENCVAIGRDSSGEVVLLDAPCDGALIESSMCEQAWTDAPECGDAANRLLESRYVMLVDGAKDYATAVARCQALGWAPVLFDTPEEYDFVRSLHPNDDFWIGAVEQPNAGPWTTVTGCPGFYVWAIDEPDTAATDGCMSSTSVGMVDRPCTDLVNALCERE